VRKVSGTETVLGARWRVPFASALSIMASGPSPQFTLEDYHRRASFQISAEGALSANIVSYQSLALSLNDCEGLRSELAILVPDFECPVPWNQFPILIQAVNEK